MGISSSEPVNFLNQYHNHFDPPSHLNSHRMQLMDFLNEDPIYKKNIYFAFKPLLDILIGCDVAIQKRINMVVQIPNYSDENLHIHSDVECGNSPFEITLWIPLVNVYDTKTMFIFDRTVGESVVEAMETYKAESLLDLGQKLVKPENYVKMDYGQALLFNPFLLHGNSPNTTNETRWALNVRLKSLFSPYGQKSFGEYFEPLKMSPLTRLAMEHFKNHRD